MKRLQHFLDLTVLALRAFHFHMLRKQGGDFFSHGFEVSSVEKLDVDAVQSAYLFKYVLCRRDIHQGKIAVKGFGDSFVAQYRVDVESFFFSIDQEPDGIAGAKVCAGHELFGKDDSR